MLQQHLGLACGIMILGFVIGVFGHISKSRGLILLGLAIIATVSLLEVVSAASYSP